MMKRYALFICEQSAASGGWDDFEDSFDDLEAAKHCRDTGSNLTLEYREDFPIHYFEARYKHVAMWVNDALRYVMRHEADETILLSDGTRPFDPHRKETL